MTNETNTDNRKSAFSEIAAFKVKLNKRKLPRVEWFRIDVDGGTGTADTWHGTGYRLVVKMQGIDGEYATSTVAAAMGMKVKRVYRSADEARADGFKFKKEWGRCKTSEKKTSGAIATIARQLGVTEEEILRRLAA